MPLLPPRTNVSNIQIWVFARVLSIHNLAQSGFSLRPCCYPFGSGHFSRIFGFLAALYSIYAQHRKWCFCLCLSYHLIRNVQSHFECRHPHTTHMLDATQNTQHTLIICTPNLRLQSNIPRWIIAIITKKWFGFSTNPHEFHVLNFANAFLSIGAAHNLHLYPDPVNIRSLRMLSHKWDICLLEAVARSF